MLIKFIILNVNYKTMKDNKIKEIAFYGTEDNICFKNL